MVRSIFSICVLCLALTGCNKSMDKVMHHDAMVYVNVLNKEGIPLPNVKVGIYTAALFREFQSDVSVPPFLSVITNNNGEVNLRLTQAELFRKTKSAELYFVVTQFVSSQNYHYWSTGGTVKAGESRKFTITTDFEEVAQRASDFEIKDGVLLKYTGKIDGAIELLAGVKEIACQCFAKSKIKKLVLNDGIEVIGDFAFYKSAIEEINFPSTLKIIGKHAFEDCTSLAKVDLSKTALRTIEEATFWGCGMIELKLPQHLEQIGAQAFLETVHLSRLELPYNTTIIGNEAFRNSGMESVQLSNNITLLGDRAFYACERLTRVTSNGDVEDTNRGIIGVGCFENCLRLEQVDLPLGVVELKGWTFIGCDKLNSLIIPQRISKIGYSGLRGCGLKVITFQGSVPPQLEHSLPVFEDVEVLFVPQFSLQDYRDKYFEYADKIQASA